MNQVHACIWGKKDWPSVNRVDNVFGDRNFVCSWPPVSEYADYELVE